MKQILGGEDPRCCGCGCSHHSAVSGGGSNDNWYYGYPHGSGRCACWGDEVWTTHLD